MFYVVVSYQCTCQLIARIPRVSFACSHLQVCATNMEMLPEAGENSFAFCYTLYVNFKGLRNIQSPYLKQIIWNKIILIVKFSLSQRLTGFFWWKVWTGCGFLQTGNELLGPIKHGEFLH